VLRHLRYGLFTSGALVAKFYARFVLCTLSSQKEALCLKKKRSFFLFSHVLNILNRKEFKWQLHSSDSGRTKFNRESGNLEPYNNCQRRSTSFLQFDFS
jgi:hypothetical protein